MWVCVLHAKQKAKIQKTANKNLSETIHVQSLLLNLSF